MGVSIKNEKVESDIRDLTELTGEGVTEAVGVAVRERVSRLKAQREAELQAKRAAIDAFLARHEPWGIDSAAVEAEMYDEQGAPR